MKKILFLGAIGALVAMPQYSYALVACTAAACTDETLLNGNAPANCKTKTESCYNNIKITSCTTCDTGYSRTLQYASVSGCSNQISFYSCVKDSSGDDDEGSDCDGTCTNCMSSGWTTLGTGYQQNIQKTCNTATCVCSSTTTYRCATGYYGTATSISCLLNLDGSYTCSTTHCQACPAADGIYTNAIRTTQAYGTVAAGNGNAKTACYLPAGTYYDATGMFTITAGCGYSE